MDCNRASPHIFLLTYTIIYFGSIHLFFFSFFFRFSFKNGYTHYYVSYFCLYIESLKNRVVKRYNNFAQHDIAQLNFYQP